MVIQYAIALKLKLGHDKYEYFSQIFNTPSSKTLDSYSTVSVHALDGILFDSVHVQQNNFETKNGMDLHETDW